MSQGKKKHLSWKEAVARVLINKDGEREIGRELQPILTKKEKPRNLGTRKRRGKGSTETLKGVAKRTGESESGPRNTGI